MGCGRRVYGKGQSGKVLLDGYIIYVYTTTDCSPDRSCCTYERGGGRECMCVSKCECERKKERGRGIVTGIDNTPRPLPTSVASSILSCLNRNSTYLTREVIDREIERYRGRAMIGGEAGS